VAVLTELADEQARTPTLDSRELLDLAADRFVLLVPFEHAGVDARDRAGLRPVTPVDPLQCVRDLAHGRAGTGSLAGGLEQVALPASRQLLQPFECGLHLAVRARLSHLAEASDLGVAHGRVVDLTQIELSLCALDLIAVHPDDDVLAPIDACLAAGRALLDAELRHTSLDRLGHPTELLHLVDHPAALRREAPGERLHEVGAAEGIDDGRNAGLLLENQLGVARDARAGLAG
jgi:hypothetical protein